MRPLAAALGALALGAPLDVFAGPQPTFQDPPFLSSSGGVLEVTLEAGKARVNVGGQRVTSRVYNRTYIPPVFRLMQGDVLRVHQINRLENLAINFHSHGVVTSPQLNGDNVFVVVEPGSEFDTEIPIPLTHQSGMYWYHPHVHPYVNQTLSHGMSSAMIIGDILAPFPELAGIKERVMILKDMKIRNGRPEDDPDPSGKTLRTINGQLNPVIHIKPGELQFWRIGNTGANIFYQLHMPGVTFHQIALDGNLQNQILELDELLLPPGTRSEVLVRGPEQPGKYKLKTRAFDTGPTGDHYPSQVMATLLVRGDPVEDPIPLPTQFPPLVDLRSQSIDVARTVRFDDTDDPNVFVIDNRVWDRDRVDQFVTLGNLEEWTVLNLSQEFHVFHIHQGDFQVTEINGIPQPFTGYQDVVNLPVATDAGPGEVVFRIQFDPPIIVGEYVYHCHIVQHEDQGMMANVLVQDELALVVQAEEPPDPIALALTPDTGNYWCN
jgi:FtsP/CotA-like multicopper oxidase with cupredoxin domain